MIIEPSIADLMKKENFESRYTLVVAAAKRAREISAEEPSIDKAVKAAVHEIAAGKVHVVPASEVKKTEDNGEIDYSEFMNILEAASEE